MALDVLSVNIVENLLNTRKIFRLISGSVKTDYNM